MGFPSDITTTPGRPGPIQQRVLDEAMARLGVREVGGQNQGPIVREVFAPFLSASRLERMYASGKLAWCAAYACYCWWRAWPAFKRHFHSEVPVLWRGFTEQLDSSGSSWAWVRTGEARAPAPADFVFFADLQHAGLVVRVDGDVLHTIEGNARSESGDTGSVCEKSYHWAGPHAESRVYGFAHVSVPGAP